MKDRRPDLFANVLQIHKLVLLCLIKIGTVVDKKENVQLYENKGFSNFKRPAPKQKEEKKLKKVFEIRKERPTEIEDMICKIVSLDKISIYKIKSHHPKSILKHHG